MGAYLGEQPNATGWLRVDPTGQIEWGTSGVPTARVYVSSNSGARTLFAEHPSGTNRPDWIAPGNVYDFTLVGVSNGAEGPILANTRWSMPRAGGGGDPGGRRLEPPPTVPPTYLPPGTGQREGQFTPPFLPAPSTPPAPPDGSSFDSLFGSLPGGPWAWLIGGAVLFMLMRK